jgi:hypothetical protein
MTIAIPVAQNKAPSLASSPVYAAIKKRLPAQSTSLFYADPGAIAALAKPELDAQGKKIADAITKAIGPVCMSSQGSGTEVTSYAVMPFRR